MTLADIAQAQAISLKIVKGLNAGADDRDVARARDLRDRAATYLKSGVEAVRAGAAFLYRGDEEAMKRYPTLFAGRGGARRSAPTASATPTAPASAPATATDPR